MVFIKDVSGNADAGTAAKWGGNDINYFDDYFDNVDITPKIARINTRTYFRSGKFEWRNPGDTFSYIIVTSAIAANRNLNVPLLAADDTFAFIGIDNSFTETQTVTKNTTSLLKLYRTGNTVGNQWQVDFDSQDSGSNQNTYSQIKSEIVSNTNGSESGKILVYTQSAGTIRAVLQITEAGRLWCGGPNQRIQLDETGLTAGRVITFKDATYQVAGTNINNQFSAKQTISLSGAATQLALYRPENTVSNLSTLDFNLNDSTSVETTYGAIGAEIIDNTNASEDGTLRFYQMIGGTLTQVAFFGTSGQLQCGGANRRIQLDETGLTTTRAITFKDANYKVAAENAANTFTGTQTVGAKLDINKQVHMTGVISPSQITSDQNNYAPSGWDTASIIRLNADSSLRSITGLGDTTQTDGMIITFRNISANTILLKDAITTEGLNSTAGNRFDFNGYDIPLFPKQEIELKYDGTLSRWVTSNLYQMIQAVPRYGSYYHIHMITANPLHFNSTAASGGSISNFSGAGIAKHSGVLRYTLGTSTTGSANMWINTTVPALLGNSVYWSLEQILKIIALSDGTNTYTLRVGFIDSATAESTDGVFFRYTHSVNSGNWVCVTRNNNTETTSNTSTAAQTSTYARFKIIVNPAGNSADFFIDGTKVANITTNIPTGAGRATSTGFMFLKSAGTTDNSVIDIAEAEIIAYNNVSN